MIALDTNLLVYAHRRDSSWHQGAVRCLKEVSEGQIPWAIPWPCLHEFLAIVTHPRIYSPPSSLPQAVDQVDCWLESTSLVILTESEAHWPTLREILEKGKVTGPQVHDARVAALCIQYGVRELWTANRDFSRFRGLRVRNPLSS